jgi:hypothetical protein
MRTQAITWWNTMTIIEKAFKLSKMKDNNTLNGRKVETLTGREIEIIYKANAT